MIKSVKAWLLHQGREILLKGTILFKFSLLMVPLSSKQESVDCNDKRASKTGAWGNCYEMKKVSPWGHQCK